MLGVLCSRSKPSCILPSSLSLSLSPHHHRRLSSISLPRVSPTRRRAHSSACSLHAVAGASIWHAIRPSRSVYPRGTAQHGACGEGSWNVAWDARPARWLHRTDSAWLLFGVCSCLAAPVECADVAVGEDVLVGTNDHSAPEYRITGVKADGRCLFRAIAHVACLRNGEEAPDDNRQRELADDLRAQVVDELVKRRKETEWFIEEDFDVYVKRIKQPYVWGGEPELLMATHVLKTSISVFGINKSSGSFMKIADYGEEYQKDNKNPITILFHRYGHYDILEAVWNHH